MYKYKPWRSSHGWCLSPVPILRAPPPPSLRVAYLLLVALQGSVFRTGGFGLMIMETSLRFHSPFPVGIFFLISQRFDRVRRFSPAAMSTSSGPKEAPANNPGLQTEVDPATKGYFLQQTVTPASVPSISPRCLSSTCACYSARISSFGA